MKPAISVRNISKQYRLGELSTGTISHDLNRWFHRIRGKEDPYLKVSATNDRTKVSDEKYVWALQDVSFDVEQGDVFGIVGRNGAGKSTLLKILSKITGPTSGEIRAYGRLASLLEVGTGFHPEMTGRENIYMNGTLMGMSRHEVSSKLDEIVEFAGVARYLNTPVKRYSSGMMVRLGFAVAAHLEPEILVVDEVLAVGDAEFQKKAIGKMKEVSSEGGRTVLYVSHNMNSLRKLCDKGIMLQNGQCTFQGEIDDVIARYISSSEDMELSNTYRNPSINRDAAIQLAQARLIDETGETKEFFEAAEPVRAVLQFELNETISEDIYGGVIVMDKFGNSIITSDTEDIQFNLSRLKTTSTSVELIIPKRVLKVGDYVVLVHLGVWGDAQYQSGVSGKYLKFSVIDSNSRRMDRRDAATSAIVDWKYLD